ncbi:MAG: hypothetical protein ABI193_16070 [Minicystis sp.]
MRDPEQLPDELVFEPDGHVGEVALGCVADGEVAIVPPLALAHIDGCELCTARLGAAALLSIGVGETLRIDVVLAEVARATQAIVAKTALPATPGVKEEAVRGAPSSRRRRPLPRAAIAAALAVAVIAAAPTWLDTAQEWKTWVPALLRATSLITRVAAMLFRSAPGSLGGTAVALRWGAALLLIVVGGMVARAMSRKQGLQGGVG